MQKISKYLLCLFAVIIVINSIGRGYYSYTEQYKNLENSISYFTIEDTNSNYFLQKFGEKLVNFANNLPSFYVKNYKSSFEYTNFVEIFFPSLCNYFSAMAEILQFRISFKVIIFPFHTFG